MFRLEPVAISVNEGTPPPGDTSIGGTIGGFISFDIVRVSGGPDAAQIELDVGGGGTNPATDDDLFAGMGNFVTDVPQGVDRRRVDIVIKADAAPEADETITVSLASSSAGTVETTAFTATIVNDDAPQNRAPVANPDAITIFENVGFSNFHFVDVTANDTDADNDPLVVLSVAPVGGAPIVADIVNNQVRFYVDDPSGDTNGVFELSYTVSDGEAQSVGLITVTVTPENDAPRDTVPVPGFGNQAATDGVFSGTEETPLVILKSALLADDVDPDGDTPLTIESILQVNLGQLVDNGDSFTFIPRENVAGGPINAFIYRVQDSLGTLSDPIVVLIDLANTPDPITAFDDVVLRPGGIMQTVTAAQMVTGDFDPDDTVGDTKDVTTIVPGNGILSAVLAADDSVTVTFAPDGTYAGRAFYDYTVVDSTGNSDVGRVVLNRAPVAQDDSGLTAINDGGTIFVPSSLLLANDSDPDGDPLVLTPFFSPSTGPFSNIEFATVGGVSGTRLTLADATYTGPAAFFYRASDGDHGTDLKSVTLTIIPPPPQNRAPVANPDAITILENDGFSNFHFVDVTANDIDADNDPLVVLSVAPVGGAPIVADIVNNQVRFYVDDPSGDTNGVFQLTYTVSDGEAQSVGLITVTVTPENDAPRDTVPAPRFPGGLATDGPFFGIEDTPLVILKSDLLADDIDPDGDTSLGTLIDSNGVRIDLVPGFVDNGDSITFIPPENLYGGPYAAPRRRDADSLVPGDGRQRHRSR